MIVFDLKCGAGHRFEAWFRSSTDYGDQLARGLVECPNCGSKQIGKAPVAPAVSPKGNRSERKLPARPETEEKLPATSAPMPDIPAELKPQFEKAVKALAKAQQAALKSSEWVGDKFAETSRRMHYGEAEEKPVHGKATAKEARDLLEEGITVTPIIVPFVPPDEVN
ncbi:DUF1178 family protein [Qipengyuania atrilutea]|uniref:DUF1178 family protein n=1 Tax=Qipengyuania atrilutea TaxID=2744473 RepID=A0A850H433_9SPHN|nr:DUF1178 family protein [Actirhodobacter atriluteus]NVD43855.1 DUF1178 family protein [Actirhodobacter atriluteus]